MGASQVEPLTVKWDVVRYGHFEIWLNFSKVVNFGNFFYILDYHAVHRKEDVIHSEYSLMCKTLENM